MSEPITHSSGNVFADLGLPEPGERLLKSELARRLGQLIAEQGLTQVQAAALLGVDQPKISALLRGRLSGFSIDRLFRLLNRLGQDVTVVLEPAPQAAAVRVLARSAPGASLEGVTISSGDAEGILPVPAVGQDEPETSDAEPEPEGVR